MKVVCISDTHEQHRDLDIPDGDLLIHAGDITYSGEPHVIQDFIKWFGELPHKHKVFVAGNHDFFFEGRVLHDLELRDTWKRIEGHLVWGSPMTPTFGNWAFMAERGVEINSYWKRIYPNTSILITHGPPRGILDKTPRGQEVGCDDLLETVEQIKPKLHVFGHIHHGYGVLEKDGTTFVNASSCNEKYKAVNKPIVVVV